jgi:hypothetical protein
VARGSFEQSVFHHGERRPQLPTVEAVGSTSLYEQLKVPVVACTFEVREASDLVMEAPDLVWGVEWQEPELVFDTSKRIAVTCSHPNLSVTATDRVVGHRRLRRWRFLNIGDSERPWDDD